MFRKDADMVKSYEEHGPEYYAAIQREIMDQAADMLAPGGYLLYSTCTFSACENEDIIRRTLECHEEMELIRLPLFEGASGGIGLPGCLRLFPHKIKGEGHFMALLKKRKEARLDIRIMGRPETNSPPFLLNFLISFPWSQSPWRVPGSG